jgi:recombination protein RecR
LVFVGYAVQRYLLFLYLCPLHFEYKEMNEQYPSVLLERAVNEFSKLPGIGKKTAMRLVLYLLRQDTALTDTFAKALTTLRHEVKYCHVCHNISDTDVCRICANPQRDAATICVVENVRDVMAIEATQQFHGLYHVLGGVISPMDGVGPGDLELESLIKRVEDGDIKEVIVALSTTMEGDTTGFYLYRKLEHTGIKMSTIARGISVGDELEYADEITLGRSIVNRMPFTGTL